MADLFGMRVRDRNTGQITVDLTDRLTRMIGVVSSGSGPGSIVVPGFSNGDGWACVMEVPTPNNNLSNQWIYPLVSISGNTLSWSFSGPSGAVNVPCNIIYGVY